eukprot:2069979-Ditylum_brightwellii.AAC.1
MTIVGQKWCVTKVDDCPIFWVLHICGLIDKLGFLESGKINREVVGVFNGIHFGDVVGGEKDGGVTG